MVQTDRDRIDSIFCSICNHFTCICAVLLLPFKILISPLTNFFQRPYSFIFFVNFFVLMTPSLLLVIVLYGNMDYLTQLDNHSFNFVSIFTLVNLLICYILTFHIYHLYGQHSLPESNHKYTYQNFNSLLFKYFFRQTVLGYIAIYFLANAGISLYAISELVDARHTAIRRERPILLTFTYFGISCNLFFTIIHILTYLVLYAVIICRLNNSCLCKQGGEKVTISSHNDHAERSIQIGSDKSLNKSIRDEQVLEQKQKKTKKMHGETTPKFVERMLDCFKFIGIFDYNKIIEGGDISYEDL